MYLSRVNSWYRPYDIYIGKNSNRYILNEILIYDENGVITNCSGWFETKNKDNITEDITSIKLPIDNNSILLKRKEDFKIPTGFIISQGKDYGDENKAKLYLHKNVINLKFIDYKKEYDSIFELYSGYVDEKNIYFRNNVKFLKNKLYDLTGKFDDIVKNIRSYDLTKETLDKAIKDLKKTGNAIFKEQEYIENYGVEDYKKEIGVE